MVIETSFLEQINDLELVCDVREGSFYLEVEPLCMTLRMKIRL